MSDLGCGEVLDLSKKGIPTNMIVRDVIKSGSSITTFSGDKLLGGPQCGLIVGKRPLIKRIKVNPIARTVRCDKWTISMLEETLRSLRIDSLKDNYSDIVDKHASGQEWTNVPYGFNYFLEILNIQDSIATAKIIESSFPFVTPRVGDKMRLEE